MADVASLKALVTLVEAVAFLGQDIDQFTQAAKDDMQRLINAIGASMENYCRVPLVKKAATEYYDGGSETILLRRLPVDTAATFTVSENGTALTPAADGSDRTTGGATPDFWLDPDIGAMYRNGTWTTGRRIVAVTYTAGVATQQTTGGATRTATSEELVSVTGPDDLREACLISVKAFTDIGPANFGIKILDEGGYIKADAWPRSALMQMGPYRYKGGTRP